MAEKDTKFSSNIKYNGVLVFSEFYKFCHSWLLEELGLEIAEEKYAEKIEGDTKNIDIVWVCTKKLTDYFKFEMKVEFEIRKLAKIEITKGTAKIKADKGDIKVKVKGVLIRDYEGKFETNGFLKFLRAIYEKYVIPSRIDQFEEKIIGDCDEFLNQGKAYLNLEGKK